MAQKEFELSSIQKDGASLREHLESVQKATGKVMSELQIPEMPEAFKQLWYWFLQLHSQRTSNGFGVNPITYQDIWFFFQLEQIEPEPWEVQIIREFDKVAMKEIAKQNKK